MANLTIRGRHYTETQLMQWIEWFHEKKGKWPSLKDKNIWLKTGTGADGRPVWEILPGKVWKNVHTDLAYGINGMPRKEGAARSGLGAGLYNGLGDFKERHGYEGKGRIVYAVDQLKQWIGWFHEKEGKWPSTDDETIWIKADARPDGAPVWDALPGKAWRNINEDLFSGVNGMPHREGILKPGHGAGVYRGLRDFKEQHGYKDGNYTVENLKQWIVWFHEKEGKWPSGKDEIIWIKAGMEPDGKPVWKEVPDKTWKNVNEDIANGFSGMPRREDAKRGWRGGGLYKGGLREFRASHVQELEAILNAMADPAPHRKWGAVARQELASLPYE